MLFGRRRGRGLRTPKLTLLEEKLPDYQLHLPCEDAPFMLPALMEEAPETWLEIGFGTGDHLARQARNNPQKFYIGAEPFFNGVASLLQKIESENLKNILLFPDDALKILSALPPLSLKGVYVLFPDPWPKKRHHKRRFISRENVALLSKVLKEGGELHLATDVAEYAEAMQECLKHFKEFTLINSPSHFPPDWQTTRFQQKAIEANRTSVYFCYRKEF